MMLGLLFSFPNSQCDYTDNVGNKTKKHLPKEVLFY